MTPELLTAIAAILSACTALIAVLIGPLISARVQHRQQVAEMREKWAHDLRDTLSELTATAERASSVILQSREISPDLRDAYEKLVRLEAEAKMMLKPGKKCHHNLQEQLAQIVALAGDKDKQVKVKMPEMRFLVESIVPTVQEVFEDSRIR